MCGLLLLGAGATNVAVGATLHVSTTGNDGNNCLSPATACLTIQAAVFKAPDDSVINIAAGTYPGFVDINDRRRLTLQGTTPTRLTGSTGATGRQIIRLFTSQNIRLANLTLTGNIPNGIGGISVTDSNFVMLSECTVEDASGGVTVFTGSEVRVIDSTIQRNQAHGVRVDNSSILTLLGAPFTVGTTVVQDNLFAGAIVSGSLNILGAVTIQGNQIGITADGGSVYSCCAEDEVERKIINNLIGISMKGGHLSLRGPGLIAGNRQQGIALVGTTAVFNRFGTARIVVRDNAAGILAIGSHVDLIFVDVINNTGSGVIFRDTSSARVGNSVISDNGDVGMLVERLSTVELLGGAVMENNSGKDLSCKLTSFGHGDKSGVRQMSCPGF
jgi:hypothetical protein